MGEGEAAKEGYRGLVPAGWLAPLPLVAAPLPASHHSTSYLNLIPNYLTRPSTLHARYLPLPAPQSPYLTPQPAWRSS